MPYQLLPEENAFQDLIDEANRPKENAFAHLIPANHKNAFEHLIPKKGESSPNTFVFRGKDGGRYTVNAPGMTEAQAMPSPPNSVAFALTSSTRRLANSRCCPRARRARQWDRKRCRLIVSGSSG